MGLGALLVPVNGQSADDGVFDMAFTLGAAFSSHISAVCIGPDPTDVVKYVAAWSYPILIEDAVATAERHAAEMTRRASAMFERWRERHQLPLSAGAPSAGVSVSWHERIGASGEILHDMARFADLVVMRGLGEAGPADGDAILEAVLFDAGRPVLLTPPKAPVRSFGTALIAWDGSREALHAIAAALPILAKMERVEIFTVDSDSATKGAELVTYLGWHGIIADFRDVSAPAGGVGEAVLDEARKIEAGLLVMGGYRRSRLREVVFGGTTRHIVTNVEIPVLLAH